MLVLTRRRGEAICIGLPGEDGKPPIRISIEEVRGSDKVRIGIEAPNLPIAREELFKGGWPGRVNSEEDSPRPAV
jgi:carbon storage regulator CsrA